MQTTPSTEILPSAAPAADVILCDDCGDPTAEWDWSAAYDRCCLTCLGREDDPAADRGCWEAHQRAAA